MPMALRVLRPDERAVDLKLRQKDPHLHLSQLRSVHAPVAIDGLAGILQTGQAVYVLGQQHDHRQVVADIWQLQHLQGRRSRRSRHPAFCCHHRNGDRVLPDSNGRCCIPGSASSNWLAQLPLKKIAFVSTRRVRCIDDAERNQILDLVVGLLLNPGIDLLAGCFRVTIIHGGERYAVIDASPDRGRSLQESDSSM